MEKINTVCPKCGFKAKSKGGLKRHMMYKEGCREALKGAEKPPQRVPEPGAGEELVDEIDILREILRDEGIARGRENILNSLKRGDIYDLYDLNEIMRERGIRPYKRRGIIRAWADTSELDVPEDLRKDLRMRGRRSRDYGVSHFDRGPAGMKRARRVEELRNRKYDRLEDLALKREIKEQQKELEAMEKGREKKSMTLMPLQQKDGSITYQPVRLPKEYAAPMMNPFMNLPQFQKDTGAEEVRKSFEKRFEKLETMMEKMREDREHKAIRDDVHRLTERFEQGKAGDKGDAWREELRALRARLDDERFKNLRDALVHKLRDLDERTRHGELDMYSNISNKLEDMGVSHGKKSREEHDMDIERMDHKKRLDMLGDQYRGVQRRVDDIVDVVKPAAKLLVMERMREESKRKGRKASPKKYSAKELESIEKALRKKEEGTKTAKKRKRGKKGKGMKKSPRIQPPVAEKVKSI